MRKRAFSCVMHCFSSGAALARAAEAAALQGAFWAFHDALYARRVLGLKPAPEFEAWLKEMEIFTRDDYVTLGKALPASFQQALARLN